MHSAASVLSILSGSGFHHPQVGWGQRFSGPGAERTRISGAGQDVRDGEQVARGQASARLAERAADPPPSGREGTRAGEILQVAPVLFPLKTKQAAGCLGGTREIHY